MDRLPIPPVDRAVMARAFAVDPSRRWLEIAYAALGTREQPITREEGERLGLDVVLHLAEVRERIRARRLRTSELDSGRSLPAISPRLKYQETLDPGKKVDDWRSREEVYAEPRAASPTRTHLSSDRYARKSNYAPSEVAESVARFSSRSGSPASNVVGSGPGSNIEPSMTFTEEDVEDVRSVFNAPLQVEAAA